MKLFEIRTGNPLPTFVMARDQRHALDLLADHQAVKLDETVLIIPVANFISEPVAPPRRGPEHG